MWNGSTVPRAPEGRAAWNGLLGLKTAGLKRVGWLVAFGVGLMLLGKFGVLLASRQSPAAGVSFALFVFTVMGAACLLYAFLSVDRSRRALEREIAERRAAERNLKARTRALSLVQSVAIAANEATDFETAVHACLDSVCQFAAWPVGHALVHPSQEDPVLVSAGSWFLRDAERYAQFRAASAGARFAPGEGLPGRVFLSGQALDCPTLDHEASFARTRAALGAGLRAGCAFPVLIGSEVAAVLEFYSDEPMTPVRGHADLLELIAAQLARVIERRRAGEVQARLAALFDCSPDAIVVTDAGGRVTDWNRGAETLFGCTAGRAKGVRVDHRIDETTLLEEVVGKGRTVSQFETRCARKDGVEVDVSLSVSPLRDSAGRIVGMSGIAQDITGRKLREAALRRSEEQLQAAQAIAHVGSWEWDIAAARLVWSDEMYRIFGLEPGKYIPTYEDFLARQHPEDRQAVASVVQRAYETGEPFTFDHRVVRPDGTVRVCQGRGTVIRDARGSSIRMLGTGQDVTELRAAEKAVRESMAEISRLVSSLSDVVWCAEVDRGGALRIRYVSPVVERVTGYPVSAISSSEAWLAIVHPDDLALVKEFVTRIAGLDGEGDFIEYRIVTPDGRTRWLRDTATTTCDKLSGVRIINGIVSDMTETKLAEIRLRETASELARSNRELEAFAYVASHDLQEPLRMVNCYLSLLHQRYGKTLDADAREFVAFAADGAQRMKTLIADLLSYARVGSEKRLVRVVDTAALLERVLADLRLAITESGATVLRGPLPTIEGDRTELVQLFQNLISNAIKFRAEEAPVVEVTAEVVGEEWRFRVKDNGIGMEMENAERVFQLFHRLNRRDEFPGTGVGLAICKKIVESHGGHIWVEAEKGRGSCFFFTLPGREGSLSPGSSRRAAQPFPIARPRAG